MWLNVSLTFKKVPFRNYSVRDFYIPLGGMVVISFIHNVFVCEKSNNKI